MFRNCEPDAEIVTTHTDVFEKDGRSISYRRLTLTRYGEEVTAETLAELDIPVKMPARKKTPSSRSRSRTGSQSKSRSKKGTAPATPQDAKLEASLRAWRKEEAKKNSVPAFRIMTDRTLLGVTEARPRNEAALLAVYGAGPSLVAKHGEQILQIVRDA